MRPAFCSLTPGNLAARAVKTTITIWLSRSPSAGSLIRQAQSSRVLAAAWIPSLVNNAVPGNYFGNDDYESTIGNSNYNALQVTVKSATKHVTYSLGYTWSKSIDQASSLSDVADPYNFNATRGLSACNLTHHFVATYDFRLPLDP